MRHGRDDLEQGDFRWRTDAHGRSPTTGASAGVENATLRKRVKAVLHGVGEVREQVEGEYLAAVGMPGQL